MEYNHLPQKQGLYDPRFEHDSCGVGFVCNIKGEKSHEIVKQGLEVLRRLSHRGATGADPKTGDGAGILIQMPHSFFSKVHCNLPPQGYYGTGLVFLPQNTKERAFSKEVFTRIVEKERQCILGWRKVPVDDKNIGVSARNSQPVIEQIFIGRNKNIKEQINFERKLYVIRKQIENIIRQSALKQKSCLYITNLSSRTFIYKGLLMPGQLESFFPDLNDSLLESAISLVHSRYSTNTFPTWNLAQPFRFLAHNGEINTLRGNINWMAARERMLKCKALGKDLHRIFPIIIPGGSDSASIDNLFELLVLSGRPLEQAMMMLIPEAWEKNSFLDEKLKDFYRYYSCMMEPWDGPAAIVFTDGKSVGAVLDRNGLRPARYIITKHDTVFMASEVGVLDIKPEDVLVSGRLEPGKIFFIDTQKSRIIGDKEIKETLSCRRNYKKWLKENMVELDNLAATKSPVSMPEEEIFTQLKSFGYTREDLKFIIKPMVENSIEPTGSMGNDTAYAALSARPQLFFNYFRQLFAQVTNPAIDPIREELVMSLESFIGPEKNLLEETAKHCHKLKITRPVITNEELENIRRIKQNSFKTKTISILFKSNSGKNFIAAINRISKDAELAIRQGYTFIILSDRGVSKEFAAIPSLLAIGAVHHYLVKKSLRKQLGIILEAGDAREVNHFALLFGYGADCINPYLAFEAIRYLIAEKELNLTLDDALHNYLKAVEKGILKILSKMGISTLQSYKGAQIFEVLGLSEEIIERCFAGTVSRIGGVSMETVAREAIMRHRQVYPDRDIEISVLPTGGVYQWKKDGEFHLWNPDSISSLQDAVWRNDYDKYKEFAELINNQSIQPVTLRGLLKFKKAKPIPIEEVEPVENIVKRFATGAMSFGSISKEAHQAIAIAMNRLGGRSNSGEGGEDPARFIPLPNGDSLRSAVKQVASGRFGVTTNYLVNADELQIKIAQGAKPGEGGQLPGYKVSAIIAKTRYTTQGVTLISPPPHHDIYSIEDLAQLIFDLKNVNPNARVSVKLVSEVGVGTVAAGVAKGHADMILISGGDGGTGASPLSSIRYAGLPWELGLSETHQTLVLNDLRSRVRLQTDGQMRTGRDVAIAALLGAEEFGFCTSVLIVLGCVMLRHCHLNNCSVGIATQDETLCQRFKGKPEYIENYFRFVALELRQIMASLGLKKIDEMIGRTEFLEMNTEILNWKSKDIDLSLILYKPKTTNLPIDYHRVKQEYAIYELLDNRLISMSERVFKNKESVKIESAISNTNRATGAMLSGEVCKIFGEEGLPEDSIYCKFKGVAGQSFAAWLAKGITFELEGMANDYVGKGVSGGKIIIYPDRNSDYESGSNIIIGNTTFYGAISGKAYIRGVAGERFCIRNSGLYAVVEGVGDHACEYMTGGRVVVLGKTGRNFAAGMSGGIAYVYDKDSIFKSRCNPEMIGLERISADDAHIIYGMVSEHNKYTQSKIAYSILDNFSRAIYKFIKVMPREYKRILEMRDPEDPLELQEVLDG